MQMISDNMIALLNYRIQQEELSSRLYLAMSQWLDFVGYVHSAQLWKKSAHEEATHASWSYSYLQDLDILPVTPELESPPNKFTGLRDVIEKTVMHEELVTQQCTELYKACLDENDFLTLQLAAKYLAEQQEELGRVYTYKNLLELYDDDTKLSLALLDKKLGKYV